MMVQNECSRFAMDTYSHHVTTRHCRTADPRPYSAWGLSPA